SSITTTGRACPTLRSAVDKAFSWPEQEATAEARLIWHMRRCPSARLRRKPTGVICRDFCCGNRDLARTGHPPGARLKAMQCPCLMIRLEKFRTASTWDLDAG